jgi:Flp pilus assembly protein TadB
VRNEEWLTANGRRSGMANAKAVFIGEIAQLGGVAAMVAGLVMSLHHWPVAVALIGGGTAYVVGKKLRAQ